MTRLWDQRNNPIIYICGYYLLFLVVGVAVLSLVYCTITYWSNSKNVLAAGERYTHSGAESEVSMDKNVLLMLDERDLYPEVSARNGLGLNPLLFSRYPDLVQLMKYNARDRSFPENLERDITRLYI